MRTIFKNRWWSLAFVAFVCWQAVEMVPADEPQIDQATQAQQDEATKAALKALGVTQG
jgi:hypothetical protein